MNICNKLLQTYNANIISKATPLEQTLFYDLAQSNNTDSLPPKGNTTLIKLINNYRLNKAPTPKYIAGPQSLTLHWNAKLDLTIYIFGETHSTQEDCSKFSDISAVKDKMWIENFLKKQILNTSAFLDIYVEWPVFLNTGQKYYELYYKPSQNRLDQIYVKLKKCLVPFTRGDSQCDLVRLHYFDIRKGEHSFLATNTNELSYLRYQFNNSIHSKNIYKLIQTDSTLQYILKKLAPVGEDDYIQFLENQLANNPKVIKELNKSFLKSEIIDFITTKIIQIGQKYRQQFLQCIPILLTTPEDENYKICFWKVLIATVYLNSLITDAYTLARIFKKFDITKSKATNLNNNTHQPTNPHNIIIYSGNAHAILYREFLTSINSIEVAQTSNCVGAKNCVNLENFPMPFFSSFPP